MVELVWDAQYPNSGIVWLANVYTDRSMLVYVYVYITYIRNFLLDNISEGFFFELEGNSHWFSVLWHLANQTHLKNLLNPPPECAPHQVSVHHPQCSGIASQLLRPPLPPGAHPQGEKPSWAFSPSHSPGFPFQVKASTSTLGKTWCRVLVRRKDFQWCCILLITTRSLKQVAN